MEKDKLKKISKEELEELYIQQNLTAKEISVTYGVTVSAIEKKLKKLGIVKPKHLVKEINKRVSIEKYGVDNPFKSKIIQQKIAETNLERYGNKCSLHGKEIEKKTNTTLLQKYGTTVPLRNVSIQQKLQETNLQRYGKKWATQTEQMQLRSKETSMARYGGLPQQKHLSQETINILSTKESLCEFINNCESKTTLFIAKKLGMSSSHLSKYLIKYDLRELIDSYSSFPEQEIKELLQSWGVVAYKDKSVISPYEIDLYCPDYKIGIEFNGTYWHSDERLPRNYHQQKSLLAESKQIFIYHIFEYDWTNETVKEKIISQLRNLFKQNNQRFYARNCTVKVISTKEKSEFLFNNHFQGNDKAGIKLGLYCKDKLVSVMTFCKPRFNKHYDWELSRFCSLSGVNVVGGANKLFCYFLRNYSGSIISYSDIGRGRGGLYQNLGFKFMGNSAPNYKWINIKTGDIKTRYQCQMKQEDSTMKEQGYIKIYDCGNKVWIYEGGH